MELYWPSNKSPTVRIACLTAQCILVFSGPLITARFEVSCSGTYVEDGLQITCRSPVIISSLEYTLNNRSPVTVQG